MDIGETINIVSDVMLWGAGGILCIVNVSAIIYNIYIRVKERKKNNGKTKNEQKQQERSF